MDSLTAELQNEKHISGSAMNKARREMKENVAMKRAIQSLGCTVEFSDSGECIVDIESNPAEFRQRSVQSSLRESDGMVQHVEKSDMSVSITLMENDDPASSPISRVCESLCPLRTRDGGCRWPDVGCAQIGSQFVGLKANFDAFDKLSIYDGYFQSG